MIRFRPLLYGGRCSCYVTTKRANSCTHKKYTRRLAFFQPSRNNKYRRNGNQPRVLSGPRSALRLGLCPGCGYIQRLLLLARCGRHLSPRRAWRRKLVDAEPGRAVLSRTRPRPDGNLHQRRVASKLGRRGLHRLKRAANERKHREFRRDLSGQGTSEFKSSVVQLHMRRARTMIQ